MTTIAILDRMGASIGMLAVLSCLAVVFAFGLVAGASSVSWRRLTVVPERRCVAYDYLYPQSVGRDIVRALRAVSGP